MKKNLVMAITIVVAILLANDVRADSYSPNGPGFLSQPVAPILQAMNLPEGSQCVHGERIALKLSDGQNYVFIGANNWRNGGSHELATRYCRYKLSNLHEPPNCIEFPSEGHSGVSDAVKVEIDGREMIFVSFVEKNYLTLVDPETMSWRDVLKDDFEAFNGAIAADESYLYRVSQTDPTILEKISLTSVSEGGMAQQVAKVELPMAGGHGIKVYGNHLFITNATLKEEGGAALPITVFRINKHTLKTEQSAELTGFYPDGSWGYNVATQKFAIVPELGLLFICSEEDQDPEKLNAIVAVDMWNLSSYEAIVPQDSNCNHRGPYWGVYYDQTAKKLYVSGSTLPGSMVVIDPFSRIYKGEYEYRIYYFNSEFVDTVTGQKFTLDSTNGEIIRVNEVDVEGRVRDVLFLSFFMDWKNGNGQGTAWPGYEDAVIVTLDVTGRNL